MDFTVANFGFFADILASELFKIYYFLRLQIAFRETIWNKYERVKEYYLHQTQFIERFKKHSQELFLK